MDIDDTLIFPIDIVMYSCTGSRRRFTDVASDQAGFSQTNVVWQRTLRAFELGIVPRPISQWERIASLFEVVDGRATGFLLKDPTDSIVASGEGFMRPLSPAGLPLGTPGFGFGVPTYRLLKRYTFLTRTKDSDIAKPQPGSFALKRGAAAVTIGAGAGNAAVDASTGWVTFVEDALSTVNVVTVGATTVVELNASIGLSVGQRLWLQGLGGADAALLNNSSHEITAVAGAEYTLSTVTTGATITAGGTGRKYPQASEALTWTGSFYVPVAFEADEIDWQMLTASPDEDARLIQSPSVRLIEVRVP